MKKNIRIARKLIADVWDDLMKDIPKIKDDETLDEEADREMEMQKELGTTPEEDADMIKRVLKKKYNLQSDDLSEVLDQVAEAENIGSNDDITNTFDNAMDRGLFPCESCGDIVSDDNSEEGICNKCRAN